MTEQERRYQMRIERDHWQKQPAPHNKKPHATSAGDQRRRRVRRRGAEKARAMLAAIQARG